MAKLFEREEHSASYKLMKYPIACRVPAFFMQDEEVVKRFGLPTSGSREVDDQALQALIPARIPVGRMAKIFSEGGCVALADPEHSLQIYGWIVQHLEDWRVYTTTNPVLAKDKVPVDDLRILDEFARSIYPMARKFMVNAPTTSRLFNRLDRIGHRSLAVVSSLEGPTEQHPAVPEEHSPMANSIMKELHRRGGGR